MAGEKKHRPTHDREVMGQLFLEQMRAGKRITEACRELGIGRATIWRWAKEDPDGFGLVLDEGYRTSQIQRLGPTPSELECSYAAGLIDGEGTIGIRRGAFSRTNNRRFFDIAVMVSNTSNTMLDWLHLRWRGIRSDSPPNTPHSKPWGRWQLSGLQAQKFLTDIFPYVIVKRPQAEIALEFRKFIDGGQMTRDEAGYQQILQFHSQIRHMNQRGTRPVVILPDKP